MMQNNMTSRRDFLKKATAATLGSAAFLSGCGTNMTGKQSANAKPSIISKDDTILFQGDSITDSGRSRGRQGQRSGFGGGNPLGNGYVYFAAARLMAEMPAYNLKILNRGISGNIVPDLDARWDTDCIELKPNVLSILIGVNDIWHTLDGRYHITKEQYEANYRTLLDRTTETLPGVKLVICEPYVLRYGVVNDNWFPEFDGFRAAAKKMSQEFNAAFVPFQTMFDEAVKDTPPEYWTPDGVHPSTNGAMLMANEWIKVVAS